MTWHNAHNMYVSPLMKANCHICHEEITCESLTGHWKNAHSLEIIGKVKCQLCDKNLTPKFMRNHLINKHNKNPEQLSFYKCLLCDFTGKTRGDVTDHVNQKHDGRRHKCEMCPLVFKTSGSLQKHIREVHCKMNELKCEECNFTSPR